MWTFCNNLLVHRDAVNHNEALQNTRHLRQGIIDFKGRIFSIVNNKPTLGSTNDELYLIIDKVRANCGAHKLHFAYLSVLVIMIIRQYNFGYLIRLKVCVILILQSAS